MFGGLRFTDTAHVKDFLAAAEIRRNELKDAVGALDCYEHGIDELANGIGLDKRIGDKYLNVGPGFGGSCF